MDAICIICGLPDSDSAKYPVLEVKRSHMHRLYIRTRILCPECNGDGTIDLYGCDNCEADGKIEVWIPRTKWHALKTTDHIMKHETQENLLTKRYGTETPGNIRDYWLAETPMIKRNR